MERVALKTRKQKKLTGSSQYGITKGILCLTNLIAFCNKMTGYVDEERRVHVQYLDFSNVYDISQNIPVDK